MIFSPFLSGFAGTWNKSWISINTTSEGRWLKYTEELYTSVEIDLKKVKNLTLVKDVKNLAAPLSHNLPILVLDCPDRSLYLQSSAEKVRKNVYLPMDFLIDEQISSICPGHHGGKLLTLIMLHKITQSL